MSSVWCDAEEKLSAGACEEAQHQEAQLRAVQEGVPQPDQLAGTLEEAFQDLGVSVAPIKYTEVDYFRKN